MRSDNPVLNINITTTSTIKSVRLANEVPPPTPNLKQVFMWEVISGRHVSTPLDTASNCHAYNYKWEANSSCHCGRIQLQCPGRDIVAIDPTKGNVTILYQLPQLPSLSGVFVCMKMDSKRNLIHILVDVDISSGQFDALIGS